MVTVFVAMLTFNLRASVDNLALAGGDREFRPFLAYHATWGTNRVPRIAKTADRVPLTLTPLSIDPNAPGATPYEAIWVQVLAWTRHSGDDELEREERGSVLRTVECGIVRFPIHALVGQQSVKIALPLHDYRAEAYLRDPNYPSKGSLVLEGAIQSSDPAARARYARWLKQAPMRVLVGADPAPLHTLLEVYSRFFFRANCRYPARTPLLRKLHLATYRSSAGMLPPVAFWLNNVYTQQRRIEHTVEVFGNSLRVYFEGLIGSQCQRSGLALGAFEALVAAQRASPDTLQPAFARAFDVLVQAASSIVYGAHYMSDMRYNARTGRPIFLESFDTPLDGIRNGIDCEDLENAPSVTLQTVKYGARLWRLKSPFWAAVHYALEPYLIYDSAALATTAFADPHRRGELVLPSELADLPLLDSAQDRGSDDIGHCHGWLIPRVIAMRAMLAGNVRRADAPRFFAQETHPFEQQLRVAVLEGTGPTDTYVMPLERAYGNDLKSPAFQDAALRLFSQAHLEKRIPSLARPPFQRKPGPFYYYDRQLADRRLSDFYHEAAHAVCAELYRENPVLSQVAFVNPDDTYGVRVEDLFAEHATPRLRFVAPFVEEQTLWAREIAPHMEAVMRQLPLTIFSDFTPARLAQTTPRLVPVTGIASAPVEQPYGSQNILPAVTFTTDRTALDRLTPAVQRAYEQYDDIVGYQWFRSRALPQMDEVYELHVYVDRAAYARDSQDVAAVLAGRIPGGFQTRINARR